MEIKLKSAEIEQLISGAFGSEEDTFRIDELREGFCRMRVLYRGWMMRPGDVLSGPAMFMAADLAIYALVLAHVGPALMAVTTNLNIHFLNPAPLADLVVEAHLLKLGKTLAVAEVRLSSSETSAVVAHATGSYRLPSAKTA